MYTYIYVCACMYVYLHTHVYMCIYIHLHTCIRIPGFDLPSYLLVRKYFRHPYSLIMFFNSQLHKYLA